MFLEIVFTACLLSTPPSESGCTNFTMAAEPNHLPFQCLMIAQHELVKWNQKNPEYRITKFGCQRTE